MPPGPPAKDQGLPTLPRGATIGRYVVLGLVGRGGMGEVYAAYDPELDRKVAVKLLRIKPGAGVSPQEGRQRTLRETNGNQSEAARRLGMTRTTLLDRLKRLGLH